MGGRWPGVSSGEWTEGPGRGGAARQPRDGGHCFPSPLRAHRHLVQIPALLSRAFLSGMKGGSRLWRPPALHCRPREAVG